MIKQLFNKKTIISIALIAVTFGLPIIMVHSISNNSKKPVPTPLVAHAGGAIYGFRLTNSLEAIESSYNNGFKLIEMDFEWTSDGELVAIHDWGPMVKRLFMTEERVLTLKEFKNSDVFMDLTLLEFKEVIKWFEKKENVFLVTDTKGDNIRLLAYIAENHRKSRDIIIPQVYSFEEYHAAKDLGFKNIILTLYKTYYNDDAVLEFARKNQLFAITMPTERGHSGLPLKLKELGVFTYVHTINDLTEFEKLHENGVSGIYTDYFHANKWVIEY